MRKLARWEYLQGNREKDGEKKREREREREKERRGKKIWKQVMRQGSRQVNFIKLLFRNSTLLIEAAFTVGGKV